MGWKKAGRREIGAEKPTIFGHMIAMCVILASLVLLTAWDCACDLPGR